MIGAIHRSVKRPKMVSSFAFTFFGNCNSLTKWLFFFLKFRSQKYIYISWTLWAWIRRNILVIYDVFDVNKYEKIVLSEWKADQMWFTTSIAIKFPTNQLYCFIHNTIYSFFALVCTLWIPLYTLHTERITVFVASIEISHFILF